MARVRYWMEACDTGNFGDLITRILLEHLLDVPSVEADVFHLTGSVIDEGIMRSSLLSVGNSGSGKVVFRGCGLRDDAEPPHWVLEHGIFRGVRGPLSRDCLRLPSDKPLGDTGLLLPTIVPRESIASHERSLCLLHFFDPLSEMEAMERSGADVAARAAISATTKGFLDLLALIAGARFVLAGALHGAIAAFAYGVPFAFMNFGYVDCPFKWRDLATSIGIDPPFAQSLEDGRRIYDRFIEPRARPLPLEPILNASPFTLRNPYNTLRLDFPINVDPS